MGSKTNAPWHQTAPQEGLQAYLQKEQKAQSAPGNAPLTPTPPPPSPDTQAPAK